MESGGKADIQKTPGFGFYYLALNQKDEILANPKVREAFRYLIDYDGLANTVMKYYGIKQETIVPAGLPGASDAAPYKLDIDKAKATACRGRLSEWIFKSLLCDTGDAGI